MAYGREITVEILVVVEVDETKFTEEWLEEFRESFYPFHDIDDHLRHLAQLYARGVVDGFDDEFIEGYGVAKEMGIRFKQPMYGVTEELGAVTTVDQYRD